MDMNYDVFNFMSGKAIIDLIASYSLVMLIIGVLSVVAMWKIFTKAGRPGIFSIIPLYNVIVLFQISGLSGWLVLLYLIPVANIIVTCLFCSRLAKAFGKGFGYTLGLLFFNTIFIMILGLGNSSYVGPNN